MFNGPLQIEAKAAFKTSTVKEHFLGALAITRDGRFFRYGKAGASDLAPGKLSQIPAVVANHQNLVVTTAAPFNSTKVTVTLGGTAATADQYLDGYLVGYDVAGFGQALQISGNSAQASTTGNVDVYLRDSIVTALTTSSKVNLELSPYGGAIISSTGDTTEQVVGVPLTTIPAQNFGWFQTKGVASVLGNGSITKGSGLIKSATTAGAVDIEGASTITQRVGLAQQTGTSTKYNTVKLTID